MVGRLTHFVGGRGQLPARRFFKTNAPLTLTRPLTTALKYTTLLATVAFAGCVLLQIFARLLLPSAPSWTEEAARLFFVVAIGAAAGLALRSREYVYFDFLFQRLPAGWRRGLLLVIDGLTVVLFTLFTYQAARFVSMGWAETSPSLRFPMAIPFAGVLLLGGSVLLYGVERLLGRRGG